MFVSQNNLAGLKRYFTDRLAHLYSESELRQIVKLFVINRLSISDVEYMLGDVKFSESDLLFFRDAVKRLEKNEPLQHVLGTVIFCDLELKSDARALIPRPETEELVYWISEEHGRQKALRMVDLCAGSGCIALALKSLFSEATVTAVELSNEALELIRTNQERTGLSILRVKMDVLSDDWSNLANTDLFVSNPPYIPFKDQEEMHANVLEYEPHMALFVENDDPLLFYREIGEKAFDHLADEGWLYVEIHEKLGDDVIHLMKTIGFVNIELRKDLQGKDRMVRGQKVLS